MPHRLLKANRLLRNSRTIIFVGLALVAAAVIAVAFLVVRSSEADFWLSHTIKVQQAGEALLSEIQLAESAKRGYLLTEESDYLNEFNQSTGAIPRLLEDLGNLVADNSDQGSRLETLGPLVNAKLAEMDDTLALDQRATAPTRSRPSNPPTPRDSPSRSATSCSRFSTPSARCSTSASTWRPASAAGWRR